MSLIRNWFLSLLVQRTVYEETRLYVSRLLSKMGNDRMGCLTLRDNAIEVHLNILPHVITWLDENKEMFESLPINHPIILTMNRKSLLLDWKIIQLTQTKMEIILLMIMKI